MSKRAGDRVHRDLDAEQSYVSMLYGRLDELRERLDHRRSDARLRDDETPGGLTLRDNVVAMYDSRLAQLDAVENGLCFGRLDATDGTNYIGRIGVFGAEHDPLLIDWRSEAARPFYTATAAHPRRRDVATTHPHPTPGLSPGSATRYSTCRLRRPMGPPSPERRRCWRALESERTGRMRDIVETIQGEQDEIIRSGLDGVLVVEGGPGTGKTAVAPASCRIPVVRTPCTTRRPRRPSDRPQRHVPSLHLGGPSGPCRDRRTATHHRRPVPGSCPADRGRPPRGGRRQGRPGDGRRRGRGDRRPSTASRDRSRHGDRIRAAGAGPCRVPNGTWTGPDEPANCTTRRGRSSPRRSSRRWAHRWPSGSAPIRSVARTCSRRRTSPRSNGNLNRSRTFRRSSTGCGRQLTPETVDIGVAR